MKQVAGTWQNLRKMTGNNPNLDIVSISAHTKFGKILFICSQDIDLSGNEILNEILTSAKGHKLCYNCAKNHV